MSQHIYFHTQNSHFTKGKIDLQKAKQAVLKNSPRHQNCLNKYHRTFPWPYLGPPVTHKIPLTLLALHVDCWALMSKTLHENADNMGGQLQSRIHLRQQ